MRTYELTVVASAQELVEAIEKLKDNRSLASKMITSLHDIVCSGERFSREDLLLIKALAKTYNNDLMIQDCDSRIRNLVSN